MLPYKLATTNDLLTSRAGLVCVKELMEAIGFRDAVNKHFPTPQSNRGFQPAVFVESVVFMLHEGGRCLDDLGTLREDSALRTLLGWNTVPQSDSLGDWLRRHGLSGVKAATEVNRLLLAYSLHHCREVTLDIDATLCPSNHSTAEWTYKKCTGYMPMVGHIAQTGQVATTDFRAGNIAPATDNLAFIHQCEAALPEGVTVKQLRIDAAGYQAAILDECIERHIQFAIRAKMSPSLKQLIAEQTDWLPLHDPSGHVIEDESICRVIHTMQESQYAFSVTVQRKQMRSEQFDLDLEESISDEIAQKNGYLYRAIAHNCEDLNDHEVVHWYNQRAEASENRIKELKNDFGAGRMPCRDFDANALFFALCALAYNLFALLRSVLPARFESVRAKRIRQCLYDIAGKVVRHGRVLYLKVTQAHRRLLEKILTALRVLAPVP